MAKIRQQHLMTLQPCTRDGALRYLAVRERGNRYEFVILHILIEPGGKKRKTMQKTLASVRKSKAEIHDQGLIESKNAGDAISGLLQIRSELSSIIADLQKGHKRENPDSKV